MPLTTHCVNCSQPKTDLWNPNCEACDTARAEAEQYIASENITDSMQIASIRFNALAARRGHVMASRHDPRIPHQRIDDSGFAAYANGRPS